MGRAKKGTGIKSYILTEKEFNYITLLNLALQFSELKQKIMSGFMYYVCTHRLGYGENVNLVFEVDLEDPKRELKVKEIPNEAIEQELQK